MSSLDQDGPSAGVEVGRQDVFVELAGDAVGRGLARPGLTHCTVLVLLTPTTRPHSPPLDHLLPPPGARPRLPHHQGRGRRAEALHLSRPPPGGEARLDDGTGVVVDSGPAGLWPVTSERELSEAGESVVTVTRGEGHRAVGASSLLQVLLLGTELQGGPQAGAHPHLALPLPDPLDVDDGHHHRQEDHGGGHGAQRDEEGGRDRGEENWLGWIIFLLCRESVWNTHYFNFKQKMDETLLPETIPPPTRGGSLALHTLIRLKLRTSGAFRRIEKLIWK